MKSVRIGAGQGFWGNGPFGAINMVRSGEIQYLCCDALAELTLAILKKGMKKDAYAGWVNDLTLLMYKILPVCKEKGIKIITNHGGLNPAGAAAEVERIAKELGITGLKIATVTGDDVFTKLGDFQEKGLDLSNMDTGESIDAIKDRILFANAYIGARPIVAALDSGADIVITGRAADSACFLAPLVHEFRWSWEDWDKLAAGTLAGHLLECSAQSTGGNFLGDWWNEPRMEEIGYPIAEVYENGEMILTKPAGSGGRVSVETVSEQMVYETLDPNNYIVPDVIADFTTPVLQDMGNDRVMIRNIKGKPRPEKLKVFIGYQDGFASSALLLYAWPDALKKARKLEEIIRYQVKKFKLPVVDFHVDYVGLNSIHGPAAPIPEDEDSINEIGVKFSIKTYDKGVAAKFAGLFPAWALDGPPATAGAGGFAAGPRELLGPWSALVDRNEIEPNITVSYKEV